MITQTTQIDNNTDVQAKKTVRSEVKDNSPTPFRAETQRQIKNRALLQKIRRHLNAGHLVQMKEPESGVYVAVLKVDHCGDQLIGDCGGNQLPWDKLTGDHVMIGSEILRLNAKPTTKSIDPGMKLLDLVAALNSMTGIHDGNVFIACIHVESDDFFLVERFMTDGDRLYAVTGHDGTCHDIVGGWVYDLRHRRYVYGEGGPLRDGVQ